MSDEQVVDDSSHYEISLTAGQAFIAFVLLLLSLAASFAFGVMIGKGQVDDRLVVKQSPGVINEASAAKSGDARIVELGVKSDPEAQPVAADASTIVDVATTTSDAAQHAPAGDPVAATEHEAAAASPASSVLAPAPAAVKPTPTAVAHPAESGVPYFAQLMSTSEPKSAEALAAKLIDGGFPSAYVERTETAKGMVYRVRVRFGSEAEARAAVDRLKPFSSSDIWVTKQ
jgi:cell division septation protein DedD